MASKRGEVDRLREPAPLSQTGGAGFLNRSQERNSR